MESVPQFITPNHRASGSKVEMRASIHAKYTCAIQHQDGVCLHRPTQHPALLQVLHLDPIFLPPGSLHYARMPTLASATICIIAKGIIIIPRCVFHDLLVGPKTHMSAFATIPFQHASSVHSSLLPCLTLQCKPLL